MSFLNVLLVPANLHRTCNSIFKTLQHDLAKVKVGALVGSSHDLISVRYFPGNHHRNERVFRPIRGGGRPVREGVVIPVGKKYGWRAVFPADGKYTTKPLPIIKLGGRDPETGRVVVRTIGGGYKNKCYWVDFKREGPPDGGVLEEKVFQIMEDPVRTARIALVASGDHKRWIIASENMKPGDIIKTSSEIPRMPVRPEEGDAHPVGALPVGTLVHCIEAVPGRGAVFCRAAGTSAQVMKSLDDKCIVQLPYKRQVMLDKKCMVVVGRASNVEHGQIPIGTPQRLRELGKRPRSGLWHRKDGYCGRKIHRPKSILDPLMPKEEEPEVYNLTWRT